MPGSEGTPPSPVFGVLCATIDESSLRSVRLLRSFAPPALPGFFATTTSADFSRALTLEISPSKVLYLSPRAARLYLVRLDGVRVSLLLASSPPAPGLAAGSCSCGRGFAFRFLQLHLTATPCGSARVGLITSLGIFHPLDTAHVGRASGDILVPHSPLGVRRLETAAPAGLTGVGAGHRLAKSFSFWSRPFKPPVYGGVPRCSFSCSSLPSFP